MNLQEANLISKTLCKVPMNQNYFTQFGAKVYF